METSKMTEPCDGPGNYGAHSLAQKIKHGMMFCDSTWVVRCSGLWDHLLNCEGQGSVRIYPQHRDSNSNNNNKYYLWTSVSFRYDAKDRFFFYSDISQNKLKLCVLYKETRTAWRYVDWPKVVWSAGGWAEPGSQTEVLHNHGFSFTFHCKSVSLGKVCIVICLSV
jgi:hypothetical protein